MRDAAALTDRRDTARSARGAVNGYAAEAEPRIVQIEITNRCNLACRLCPHAGVSETGDMTVTAFARIVDQLLAPPDQLYLCGLGEPLLHRGLEPMIAHATTQGITNTIIHTNGTALTTRRIDRLAEAGLAELHLSLDGGDAAALEAMRPGVRLAPLIGRMRHLTTRTSIRASLHFTANRQNLHSLPALADVAWEMGVRRISVADTVPFFEANRAATWATRDRKLAADGGARDAALAAFRARSAARGLELVEALESSLTDCSAPFFKLYVTWKGAVTPCCRIHQAPVVGDLTTTSLAAVWHGPALDAWRRRLVSDEPPDLCRTLCQLPGLAARRRRTG